MEALLGLPELEDRVREVIAKQLDVDKDLVTRNAAIVEDLGADSLDVVEVCMAIEERLGVTIEDEVFERISTVGDYMDCVARLKANIA